MELSANVDVCFVSILGITQGFLPIAGFNYGAEIIQSEGKCTAFNKIFTILASLILWLF
jgi:hypothetical protein